MSVVDTRTGEILPVSGQAIEQADPARAAEMVTAALMESRSWLVKAMQGTDPTPIAEFKAWAATIEEATKQKHLGREIELDAAEMVRRAERGIGVAIRNGQEAGEIETRTEALSRAGRIARGTYQIGNTDLIAKAKVSDFVSADEMSTNGAGIADLTDGVSDADFDAAVLEAKAEHNLSRANVARKVKKKLGVETPAQTKPSGEYRLTAIEDMAARGMSSGQIADELGYHEQSVRKWARDADIEIAADKVLHKSHRRIDHNNLVEQTVIGLEGMAITLRLLNYDELDRTQTAAWASSLHDSLRTLNRFRKQIEELTQ